MEISPLRWIHDRRSDTIIDDVIIGATTLRYGATQTLEIDIGWAPLNISRRSDPSTGKNTSVRGVGDLSFGLRKSLSNPDGTGIAVAIQTYVIAPTARDGIGFGFWLTGVQVPFSADLAAGFTLGITPGLERVTNASGDGRHMGYTGAVRLARPVGPVQLRGGFNVLHDADPDLPFTQFSTSVTAAWSPQSKPSIEFDAGVTVGLTSATPDLELFVAVVRQF